MGRRQVKYKPTKIFPQTLYLLQSGMKKKPGLLGTGRPVTPALGFLTVGKRSRSTAPPTAGGVRKVQTRDSR